jgi:hypothetical protein
MDDVSSAALHLVALCDYLAVFFGGVFVEGLMLAVSQDDALEERPDLVFWEIVTKFTHFVEKIDIFI